MSEILQTMLKDQPWILADGATGTNLFEMGLEAGAAPELWNETKPENIKNLYRQSVEAGSDLFLTNSFGSNATRLNLHNAGHRAFELSKLAAEIGRSVADSFQRPVVVAGSVGPTGEILQPVGTFSRSEAIEVIHEQAEGLKAGGADVLWLETMSSSEEFMAAVDAFSKVDLPWCGTMSFDTAGRTMMGITSKNLVALVRNLNNPPLAFGANCGTGASDILRTLQSFTAQNPSIPLISKGNAGIPKYVNGCIHYDGTPDLMATYAVMARDSGASIIGGCCGTMPQHIKKMRKALENRLPAPMPSFDEIQATLGTFSSIEDGTAPAMDRPRRTSRRKPK